MSDSKNNKLKVGLIIAVILVAAIATGIMNFSSVAKNLTQRIATETLGVPVTISGMDIKLQERKVTLSGLKIGNPKGYSKPHAMTFGSIVIDMDAISKELITFDDIAVGKSDIYLEVTENGTNLGQLKKNVEAHKPANKAEEKAKQAIKVIVKKMSISETTLHPSVTLASGDLTSVKLPTIALSGIGQKTNGVLAAEAIGQILDKVVNVASKAAAKQGFLQGLDTDFLNDLDVPTSLLDQIGGDTKTLGDGIKSFFGN